MPTATLGSLGTEVWRFGERRIAAAPETNDRIQESHKNLVRCLEQLGVRIQDPLGERYIEGMNADVIDLPNSVDAANEILIITDVLRPTVFIDGVCIVSPQIIVEREERRGRWYAALLI